MGIGKERILKAERAVRREIHADVIVADHARAVGFVRRDEFLMLRHIESNVERRFVLRNHRRRRFVGSAPVRKIVRQRHARGLGPRIVDDAVDVRRRIEHRDRNARRLIGRPGRQGRCAQHE